MQPDMEELTENAEEPDEGSKHSEQKLGKLQYKVFNLSVFRVELVTYCTCVCVS